MRDTLVPAWIVAEIELVVVLRVIPGASVFHRDNLRDNRLLIPPVPGNAISNVGGDTHLLIIVCKDGGSILCSCVIPLSVRRGRVVHVEEKFEKLAVADRVWVEGDLKSFRVAGGAAADGPVGRW